MVVRANRIRSLSKDLRRLENLFASTVQVRAANAGDFHPDLGFFGSDWVAGLLFRRLSIFRTFRAFDDYHLLYN